MSQPPAWNFDELQSHFVIHSFKLECLKYVGGVFFSALSLRSLRVWNSQWRDRSLARQKHNILNVFSSFPSVTKVSLWALLA